jgi:pimeloyl-ACP methyl ester carboxylesterase
MISGCKMAVGALLLAALLGGGPAVAQGGAPPAADLGQLLAYESKPLDVKVVGTEKKGDVRVEDITFGSVAGNPPIQAYVVRPDSGSGPFAGVLFVHWFAYPHPKSNRTQFLEEAEALARRGTVSLLVSTFWSSRERYDQRKWETDFQNSLNQAKDLRHALDVLLAQPGVDPQRIGYVGHDYGAMFGALMASVDTRAKAHVHIAGTARFSDWYLFGSSTGVPKGADLENFRAQIGPIEPVNAIGKAKGSFFFQWGEKDRYTRRKDFIDLYMAAPEPKRMATYPAEHEMSEEIILHDRTVWLAEQLGLPAAK